MTELRCWDQFVDRVRYRIAVEVEDQRVTITRELFMDLMKQSGWTLESNIIEVPKEPVT
jgi:hypothetical protein